MAPPVLSLFPGAEGTAELQFAPPRKPELSAERSTSASRWCRRRIPTALSSKRRHWRCCPSASFAARITPRTSEATRTARHEVVVDDRGNAPLEAELSATDPDEQLAFDLRPLTLTVPPGQSGRATVKVAARKGFARGADKHRPANTLYFRY